MECGEQSVMTTGMIMMQWSFADNLDMTLKVTSKHNITTGNIS